MMSLGQGVNEFEVGSVLIHGEGAINPQGCREKSSNLSKIPQLGYMVDLCSKQSCLL